MWPITRLVVGSTKLLICSVALQRMVVVQIAKMTVDRLAAKEISVEEAMQLLKG